MRHPANWWRLRNPWRPSWGEPYREIAARMVGAVAAARDAARGHAAVCVSHQLPIWTLRLHLEGRSYLHDPRRRECGLASVTSLTYVGDRLSGITYTEPAGATDPDAVPGA
jgi:broad specificity phosphatase PhoE